MIISAQVPEIKEYAKKHKLFVALGYFDGVHRGHQALLEACLTMAQAAGGEPCVLLLEPHPLKVLRGTESLRNLNTIEQRVALIQKYGGFNIFILPFTREFAALTPTQFVQEYLIDLLQVGGVVSGFNYSFGAKGLGHSADLIEYGRRFGFQVQQVPPVKIDQEVVSSTLIRQYIENGLLQKAASFLGHQHIFMGKVEGGNQLGSLLGFPTANLAMDSALIWPAFGVYGAWIKDENGQIHQAVVNVGIRPTLKQQDISPSFEAHLLNYSGNLYDTELQVILTNRIRKEQTFPDLEALKAQVLQDKNQAIIALQELAEVFKAQNKKWAEIFYSCLDGDLLI